VRIFDLKPSHKHPGHYWQRISSNSASSFAPKFARLRSAKDPINRSISRVPRCQALKEGVFSCFRMSRLCHSISGIMIHILIKFVREIIYVTYAHLERKSCFGGRNSSASSFGRTVRLLPNIFRFMLCQTRLSERFMRSSNLRAYRDGLLIK
jgi:hypothetical protein